MDKKSLLRTDKEFLELYNRNSKRTYQICFMHLKNHHEAEDAVQTVFLKYIQSGKVFQDVEYEKAWFIVTAQNHCRDVLRRWWRQRQISLEDLPEIPFHDNQAGMELMNSLLALPSKYKNILYLYYFEGYTVKEISSLLGRNESTVRTQLSTGRKRLKIDLGGYHE